MRIKAIKPEHDIPRTTRPSAILWALPLLLALGLGGCKHNQKHATDADPAGTYTLVSVDGKQVPCTIEHGGHTLAVESGTFVINADGTCSSKVLFSPPEGRVAIREVKASYTRQGAKLTMKWEGAGTTIGTVAPETFTMNNEGMQFVYQRSAGSLGAP